MKKILAREILIFWTGVLILIIFWLGIFIYNTNLNSKILQCKNNIHSFEQEKIEIHSLANKIREKFKLTGVTKLKNTTEDIRIAIKSFYEHYDSQKIPTKEEIDELAKEFAGKENQLWASLYDSYDKRGFETSTLKHLDKWQNPYKQIIKIGEIKIPYANLDSIKRLILNEKRYIVNNLKLDFINSLSFKTKTDFTNYLSSFNQDHVILQEKNKTKKSKLEQKVISNNHRNHLLKILGFSLILILFISRYIYYSIKWALKQS